MNTTETKEVEATALAKVLTDSKLELTEAEEIKQSYLPYFEQMAVIKQEASKINFDNPTELDETIARNLRLRTVKIRTGSMAVKEERKRIHMLKANVEQSAWNLIKTTCELDEELFLQIEKKREIAEKARLEARKTDRLNKLAPFNVDVQFIDLLNMPDDGFDKLLAQSELAFEQAKAELLKAEKERIERERVAEEKRLEMIAENKRLREEAEAKEEQLAKERAKAEAEKKAAEQEAKRIADETAKREAEAKAKADAEQKKMREEAQKKIEAERKERERIEQELADKKEQEAKRLEVEKAAEEKRLRLIEEAKEAELSKGDAEKIADLAKDLTDLKTKYVFKSAKSAKTYAEVGLLLDKIINHLNK
jgi:hypothetical protein